MVKQRAIRTSPSVDVRHYVPGGLENGGGIGRLVGYIADAAILEGSGVAVSDTRGPRWSLLRSPIRLVASIGAMVRDRIASPDRIHHIHIAGRGSTARKLVLCAAARGLGCVHVLHLHDYDYATDFTRRTGWQQALILHMFQRADQVLVLGQGDRNMAADLLHVDLAKLTVLRNCVPDPGPRTSKRGDVPTIVFLGQLGVRKGVPELIRALASPSMMALPWHAVIAGDGPVATYRAEAERLGLGTRVTMPGWIDRTSARRLCSDADILVLPSHNEGMAMAVIEGLAYGLAVVTTRVGAHEEAIADGITGIFVPVGDPVGLAAELARLVAEPAERERLSSAARAHYLARFSMAGYMRSVGSMYARLSYARNPGAVAVEEEFDMTRRDEFPIALRSAAPPPLVPEQADLDPMGLVRLIRRRFWQIVGISALVVALALPLILEIKPAYYAGSRLLIQSPLTTALATSAEERMIQLNLTTEVERMLSRDVAVQVIDSLDLDQRPEFNPTLREESRIERARNYARNVFSQTEPSSPQTDNIEGVVAEYFAALSIAREPMSDVVQIGFVSADPELAAAVPNSLLQVYLSEREASLANDIQRAQSWLALRIADQEARVESAVATLQAFGELSGLLLDDPLQRAHQVVDSMTTVMTDIERKRFEIKTNLAELETVSRPSDKVAIIAAAPLDILERELRLRRAELERLLRTYGENHPSSASASFAVEAVETELGEEIDRQVRSMQSRLSMLEREEFAVESQLATAAETISRLNAAMSQRDELKRVSDAEQATLERLQEQSRALTAEGKLPIADVEVLSPASLPLAPIGRGRLIYLVAAILGAGLIGLTVAAALDFIDRSVRSFQQLQDLAGITEASMVPKVSRRIAGSRAGLVNRGHEGRFGEALRGLSLSLKRSGGGRLPTSLLVTSPLPGEGKSLIAAALAVDAAASGQRVLLVDSDLSHGRIHRLFGGAEAPGFAEYLRGEAELDDVIRSDAASGVEYIARGKRVSGRPHGSDRIVELLDSAKQSDRFLIFDSSPVFAGLDSAKLAMEVERTILVIRWGKTRRDAVESAIHKLRSSLGADMLVVINMVNPRRHGLYGFKESESYSKALRRYEAART